MPATIAQHAARAVDRSGPGPRPRPGRSSTPRGRLPSRSGPRRAHHAGDDRSQRGRLSIDADQGHGRGREDPRRHAGRLPSWSGPRHAHHAGDDRSPRGRLPIDADQGRGREDPRRHAGRLPGWSGPRRAHHAGDDRSPHGRLSIEAEHGHGRGKILDADQVTRFTTRPVRRQPGQALDATRPAAELVRPSTCSPCRRRSLTMRPGLSIEAEHAHGRGKILDADQVTRFTMRAGLSSWSTWSGPRHGHHAGDDRSARGPGCRSKRTRATAAGRSSTRTR
jgi:hypothetical protein